MPHLCDLLAQDPRGLISALDLTGRDLTGLNPTKPLTFWRCNLTGAKLDPRGDTPVTLFECDITDAEFPLAAVTCVDCISNQKRP